MASLTDAWAPLMHSLAAFSVGTCSWIGQAGHSLLVVAPRAHTVSEDWMQTPGFPEKGCGHKRVKTRNESQREDAES